jgi:hypothetical protein
MAVNTQKFLPSSKSVSLAKVSQNIAKGSSSLGITEDAQKNIGIIRVKVIEIDKILKGTLASQKKQLDNQKRQQSSQRREKQEEKLETKPDAEKGQIKMPKAPRLGIFDWIKNFIGNIILGYFAVRLVDHLPKIIPIVKFIGKATDLVLDIGGKLLDGLVTFIDWGYKAYDATRGFIKNIGGENFAKGFDKFIGAIDTALFLTTALAGSMALEAMSGDDGGGLMDLLDIKKAAKAAKGASAAKAAGVGAAGASAIVAGAGLLASALGEGAFQLKKFGNKGVESAKKAYEGEKNWLMKPVRWVGYQQARFANFTLGTIGALLDIVGTPFRYAIELIRYPFLSDEDKVKQANNLAKFDSRIREQFREGLNALTFGLTFKEKGSFGNIFGNESAQKEMMSKMAGGGRPSTRGGKKQTGARRTISKGGRKGKYKRTIARKPGEVQMSSPGADVGGEEKLFGIFPNPFKKVVDVFNPFKNVADAGKNLGKSDYFGPILAVTSKILLGQKPNQKDYENVGLGINLLISKGIDAGKLKGGVIAAFAEGGLVDPKALEAISEGGNISDWVAKAFKDSTDSNAQKTLRLIKENAKKKKSEEDPKGEGDNVGGTAGQFSPTGLQGDIYKYLLSRGMSDNHALGIMANIHRESGFRPGVSESGGPGVGLFQYSSGGRKSAFLKAVPDYPTNWKGQIDFAIKEDVAPQYFKQNFSSAQDAADWWMRKWERPAEYIQNDKGPKIHAQYLAGLQKYKTQKGYQIPGSADQVTTAAATGTMGDRQKAAGDLGSFIKSLGVARGSGVHEHPQHGGIKHQHRGRGHYEGRAIDIGGWGGKYGRAKLGSNFVDDQSAILAGISKFAQKTGKKPSLLLHGDNDPGHWDHVHAEYEKGGETLDGPHLAMVGEKGREIVIDNDSVESHPEIREMLLAINQASNYQGVLKAIQQYAPYDAMSPQTVIIPSSPIDNTPEDYSSQSSGGLAMFAGGEADNPFRTLYQGT